ncbi:MAG TPA: lytic transglycosylase domain-containing protein, partial [Polyangiaceae bacterium]|nr:lytic transglycosylase domain-containing protein [Polyangiaceae bacterium]
DVRDRSSHTQATAGGDAAAATAAPSAAASAAAQAALAPADDWRDAARVLDWKRAYQLLAALPEDERKSPEMRLAYGRIALGAGEHAEAVQALENLEQKLPALKSEIVQWYAEAAAVAGPHDEAAKLLAASPKVLQKLAAAEAWLRAGKPKEARKLADAAVQRARRNRRKADEREAHWVRARIAEAAKDVNVATTDLRWLVKNHPDDPRCRDAIATIDRLKGALTLTERATALAETATVDNLDSTLETFADLEKKHPAEKVPLALAKARAIYKTRDYAGAQKAYDEAGKLVSGFAAEALYYAARATTRMGDPEGALKRYDSIVERFPKNGWAERAAYRRAELLLVMGRYAEAAKAWGSYHARFGKGRHATDARYGQALAKLLGGEADKARALFAGLRKDAHHWRDESSMRHLEGVAAMKAGDVNAAKAIWLELVKERPLTWAAMASLARLAAVEHSPLPEPMPAGKTTAVSPLPLSLPPGPATLASVGLDLTAEQHLARMEQEAAERYVARESEALCEMYGKLAGAYRRYRVGARGVSLEQLMAPPTSATRWSWNCVYPTPYADLVAREEKRRGIPSGFVHAVMRQESAFRTTARSPVGAQGLMQLMPNTAKRAAEEAGLTIDLDEVYRPDINVTLGAFYLGKLLGNFGGSAPLAAAAYNAGPHAVKHWLTSVGPEDELDLWVARIPYRETRHYVERVMANHARYQWLAGGPEAVTPLPLTIPQNTSIGDDAY